MQSLSRFAIRPLLSALCLAMLVAACGGSDEADPTTTTAASGGSDTTEFEPVTFEHRYGTTEVDERPQRIVSLDTQWTDALLALGTTPVGYLADYNVPDGFPWRGDDLADSTEMTATDALPMEQIAALRPDLIVVTYFAQNQADYDKLAAIAPTITTLSDAEVDTWQEITVAAGQVVGEPATADEVVASVDGQVAAVAEELPGLAGKTFAFANYVKGDAIYVVSDPDDGAVVLFDQLGMVISPAILEAAGNETGRVKVGFERTDLLDADLLALLTNGEDPSTIPSYDTLPAVKSGAVSLLDYADATALNTPTPLSVPYVLEVIRPALEVAAAS